MSQPLEALALATEYRAKRLELRRQIKGGETCVSDVLVEHPVPQWLSGMRIEDLLDAIRYMPRKSLHSMLHGASIKLTASVGDLTYRKRRVLADELGAWESKRKPSGKRCARHGSGPAKKPRMQAAV